MSFSRVGDQVVIELSLAEHHLRTLFPRFTMKYFLVLLFLAVLCICNSVCGDDSNPAALSEKEDTQTEEFYSMVPLFSDSEGIQPFGGMGFYRRCIRVRCPINCTICICRCIKWA